MQLISVLRLNTRFKSYLPNAERLSIFTKFEWIWTANNQAFDSGVVSIKISFFLVLKNLKYIFVLSEISYYCGMLSWTLQMCMWESINSESDWKPTGSDFFSLLLLDYLLALIGGIFFSMPIRIRGAKSVRIRIPVRLFRRKKNF